MTESSVLSPQVWLPPALTEINPFVLSFVALSSVVLAFVVLSSVALAFVVLSSVALAFVVLSSVVLAFVVLAFVVLAFVVLAFVVLSSVVLSLSKARLSHATKVITETTMASNDAREWEVFGLKEWSFAAVLVTPPSIG